jgi:hypothetical protein
MTARSDGNHRNPPRRKLRRVFFLEIFFGFLVAVVTGGGRSLRLYVRGRHSLRQQVQKSVKSANRQAVKVNPDRAVFLDAARADFDITSMALAQYEVVIDTVKKTSLRSNFTSNLLFYNKTTFTLPYRLRI